MMAEALGKSGGYCKGKGGSMHIADVTHGNLGATGHRRREYPRAVGAALAQKILGTDRSWYVSSVMARPMRGPSMKP